MNDELNKITLIIDVERAQREAVVLPDPVPTENTTSTSVIIS
jgi:hypothetical protein